MQKFSRSLLKLQFKVPVTLSEFLESIVDLIITANSHNVFQCFQLVLFGINAMASSLIRVGDMTTRCVRGVYIKHVSQCYRKGLKHC